MKHVNIVIAPPCEMVETPLGPIRWDVLKTAYEQMYDPNTTIAIMWGIEDVKSLRNSLTDEQCMEVLGRVEDKHDACVGVNWDVIDWHIYNLYGDEDE